LELTQALSKVEVEGLEARYYDTLMNMMTLGKYPSFIESVIDDLGLRKGDRVLDLGAGTGRNALLIRRKVGAEGEIIALEIGREMQKQFRKNTFSYENIHLVERRIDEPLPPTGEFDCVFASFVLHGFVQEKRDIIIENAYRALRPGGILAILDYNGFDVEKAPVWVRFAIRKMECPLAEDFIRRDIGKMLSGHGFDRFDYHTYFRNYLRLVRAARPSV
jgi:demethylmenaquinone methyltransferase/2-methoxy-6-polyprenyl-1,4-benzoquinol methylase